MGNKKRKRMKGKNVWGFFRLVAERIVCYTANGQNKTAANIRCALKHFVAFRKGEDIGVEELSVNLIKDFQNYLIREKRLKMNTVSLYMRMLRAVYNYAVDEEIIDEDKRPFRKAYTGQERTRKRALPKGMVEKLIVLRLDDPVLEFTRDMFLFSIYMQGMPFVDIAHLEKSQVREGYIVYQRRKTNRTLRVKIDLQAQRIIDKYWVEDRDSPYLFPILTRGENGVPGNYNSALRLYNKRLKRLSGMMQLAEPLTSYVSRHTWASLARSYGISDTIISEAMGHTDVKTTTIYLAALDSNRIAGANRRLIASLMRWRI